MNTLGKGIFKKLSEILRIRDKTFVPQAFQGFQDVIQEETELIAIREEPGRIMWEKQRNPKKEFEALLVMSKKGEVIGRFFPDHSIIHAIHFGEKGSAFKLLSHYKKELRKERYCKAFLQYVSTKQPKWLLGIVEKLEPLTEEQKKVWKQVRLQNILK